MKLIKKPVVLFLCMSLILSALGLHFAESPSFGMTGKSCSAEYQKGPYYAKLNKVVLTSSQRTNIVNIALSQAGYLEGTLAGTVDKGNLNITEYGRWIGNQNTWCAIFVSWCAYQAGVPTNIIRKTAAPLSLCESWKTYSSNAYIQPGDIVYVNNGNNHAGIVWKVDSTYIYTVEGNTSDKVRSDVRYRRSDGKCPWNNYNAVIKKYCSPAYGGSSSIPTQCSHTYTTGSEALHPHKEYKKCTKCGYTYYTGVNFAGKISSCSACKGICTHTYWTGWEAAHPHKEFKKCSKCGYYYYTGVNYAGKISSCSTCKKVTNTINLTSSIPDGGITVGTDFKFAGTVTSSHNVASVTATLKGGNISWVFDSGSMNVKSYNLSALNSKFNMAKLPAGTYTLQINMVNVGTSLAASQRYSKSWTVKIIPKSCSHSDVLKCETAHPHKEFLECKLCGRKEYTGRNQKVSSCEICNPKEETHECSYTLYYETEHPHEGYYRCDVCGNQKSAGIYGKEDWCEECFPGVKAVEFELKKEIDSVVLEWDKDGFFEEGRYYLYRSVNGEPFEIIEEGQDICEYTDRDIKPGSIYQYYVEVKKDGSLIAESNIHETFFSEVSDLKSNVQNIKIKTLKAKKSKSKITLSWKKSTAKYRVDGYIVLRASSKGGTYTKIFTTKKQSIVTKKLPKKGKSYYYKVRGYRKIDGRTVYTKSAVVRVKG